MTVLFRLALTLVLLVAASRPASADTVKLTIRTDPAGASVYTDGDLAPRGYAPYTAEYDFGKDFFKHRRCDRGGQVTVRWASGAEVSVAYTDICGATGKNQQIVFVRPTDVPGREIDARFALELERIMATAPRGPTWGEALARVGESWRRQAAEAQRLYALQQLNRINCTSNVVGSYVYTTCY